MKTFKKYTVATAIIFIGLIHEAHLGFAQTNQKETEGEIVMTQEELESFLNKIAQRKKQQIEKRKKETLNNQLLTRSYSFPQGNSPSGNNAAGMEQEIRSLHNKIDYLLSLPLTGGQGSNTMSYEAFRASSNLTDAERNFYDTRIANLQAQVDELYRRTGTQPPASTIVVPQHFTPESQQANENRGIETAKLQQQIDSLQKAANLIMELSSSQPQDGEANQLLQQKVADLTKEIESLKKQQDAAQKSSSETQRIGYKHTVYFGNNSSKVSGDDLKAIRELANNIRANKQKATIVLRGFSSTTGNAQYNDRLSFERADAVRKVLLDAGLNSETIETHHHGADDSKSEKMARRVEISVTEN